MSQTVHHPFAHRYLVIAGVLGLRFIVSLPEAVAGPTSVVPPHRSASPFNEFARPDANLVPLIDASDKITKRATFLGRSIILQPKEGRRLNFIPRKATSWALCQGLLQGAVMAYSVDRAFLDKLGRHYFDVEVYLDNLTAQTDEELSAPCASPMIRAVLLALKVEKAARSIIDEALDESERRVCMVPCIICSRIGLDLS